MGAKIDLNETVDSSVNAFCHARKIAPQSSIGNGRQIARSNSNVAPMPASLVKTLGNQ